MAFTAFVSIVSILYALRHNLIVAYGDAESHLNIAKRVIAGLTPGAAQLGGIWLPLPHILMIPFVAFDGLWQTGLAGSIVSGIAYVVSTLYIYKLVNRISQNRFAGTVAAAVFALNPNILYMQTTPMSELPLIAFFILSTYYFFRFLDNAEDIAALILAAVFALAASLSRYDGWLLVMAEAGVILFYHFFHREDYRHAEGNFILFSIMAFSGIALWLLWGFLILGDPFYFTNSPFSAKSQQQGWLLRGELPTYRNLPLSAAYYAFTSLEIAGYWFSALAIGGLALFLLKEKGPGKLLKPAILLVPFIFYVVTLYLGQSVIFIPGLTPDSFEYNLFNVRYGLMMVPVVAFFTGYLLSYPGLALRGWTLVLMGIQGFMFLGQNGPPLTLKDGTDGLSASRPIDAERFLKQNYDHGLVLMDDYARTVSIIRTGIPLHNYIYVGNKPYWDESLKQPAKYARWIVMQRSDSVWKNVYANPRTQRELYKYFNKTYTSRDILVFKRNDNIRLSQK